MNVESQVRRPFDWNLFWTWVLANGVGLLAASVMGGAVAALIILILGEIASGAPSKMGEIVLAIFITPFIGGLFAGVGGTSGLMSALVLGGRIVGETVRQPMLGPPVMGSVVLAVAGAAIGMGQWLVLRPHLHQNVGWVFASIAGWGLAGMVLGTVVYLVMFVPFTNTLNTTVTPGPGGTSGFQFLAGLVSGAVGGGVSGIVQWFILRRNFYEARWWVGTSFGGWALGGAIAATVVGGAGLLLGGAIAGVITGVSLTRLSRHPLPDM